MPNMTRNAISLSFAVKSTTDKGGDCSQSMLTVTHRFCFDCVCLYCSVDITDITRSQDKDGRKTVQFEMHEDVPVPFFGYPSKVHAQVPLTVKELEENVAIQISAYLFKGWFQFNQGFRFTDAKEGGGTILEERCQYIAPRIAVRYISSIALALHKGIMENTRKYFMEIETQNP